MDLNKGLAILIGFILVGLVIPPYCFSYTKETPTLYPAAKHPQKCKNIIMVLQRFHYADKALDNSLSERILKRYLDNLDPGKKLFTAHDIALIQRYQYRLDDDLAYGNLSAAYQIFNLYLSRSVDRLNYTLDLLDNWKSQIDFSKNESLIIDNDFRHWQKDYPSLQLTWKKDLKNHIITLLLEGRPDKDITDELKKIYDNRKKRMLQTTSDDVFSLFMNAVTTSFDPHTQYFPPRLAEDFDINMKLSLEGIGAVLQNEYEYTKVVRLIPKGPADKSNLLMPGDKIIGVGQGRRGEIKDTIGLRIDNVVKLIRGPKNSIVRLKIIPAKQTTATKTIEIKRDKVKLEDRSAQKELVTIQRDDKTYKIGIIEFPSFYSDWAAQNKGDKNYRSVSRDVKQLITELKKEQIDGLIIDLRDNGGGSLQEATELTGLFIKSGPIVQVRDKDQIVQHYDQDPKILYTGPLMVMINRMSASASEIFAAAIKDYHRGVVVGSRSFGKGTVQHMRPMDRKGNSKIKLTEAKFYRISGDSTQHKGVLPDIQFPKIYKEDHTGESSQEGALLWDKIFKTAYRAYQPLKDAVFHLTLNFSQRKTAYPEMTYLEERIRMSDAINEQSSISLRLDERKEKKKALEEEKLAVENNYRKQTGQEALESFDPEKAKLKEFKSIIMDQTHELMADLILFSEQHNLTWQ